MLHITLQCTKRVFKQAAQKKVGCTLTVSYSNQHLNNGQNINKHLNNCPYKDWTPLDQSNTYLVRYSDPHCTDKLLHIKKFTLSPTSLLISPKDLFLLTSTIDFRISDAKTMYGVTLFTLPTPPPLPCSFNKRKKSKLNRKFSYIQ